MTPPARLISVEARPGPMTTDLAHSAVLVIDMQNDFGAQGRHVRAGRIRYFRYSKGGRTDTMRHRDGAKCGRANRLSENGASSGYSDTGGPDSPHGRRHRRLSVGELVRSSDGRPSRILIDDTWNTEILPELVPVPGDTVVRKHRYSGFFETELDARLRALGARSLFVTGCTTSVCVESTVRDAMFRDYDCLVLEDCTGQPEPFGAPVVQT